MTIVYGRRRSTIAQREIVSPVRTIAMVIVRALLPYECNEASIVYDRQTRALEVIRYHGAARGTHNVSAGSRTLAAPLRRTGLNCRPVRVVRENRM